jgi:hypothetical protein
MFPHSFVTNLIAKPMPFAPFAIAVAAVTDSKKTDYQ